MFSIIQRSTNFYSQFYVHLLCDFFGVSEYDEMNCDLVSRVFYNLFWSANFGYMQ